jgi:hypothetical protein
MKMDIRGLQEAQARNVRRIAKLKPGGEFGQLLQRVTAYTHSQAVRVTHIDTGALRASHRMEITDVRGRVFIDPSAHNPRSKERVEDYAEIEENRGGGHAFYKRATEASAVYFRAIVRQAEKAVAE